MEEHAWLNLMNSLSIGPNLPTHERLCSAYAEKHRHYHTSAHIQFCLARLSEHRSAAQRAENLECAIWFHDAVYNPMRSDNELKSAEWASQFLRENGSSRERSEHVRYLIMATVHDAPALERDTQLLVDIDLAILGTDEASYWQFEDDVRKEYKWVPGPLFRRKRRAILQSFLDRRTIYCTEAIREKYEAQARHNIGNALRRLR